MKDNYKISVLFLFAILLFVSCGKTQTYADLLKQEQESITKFLESNGRFTAPLPANKDEILTTEDPRYISNTCPFYELENGVYMQVVSKGNGEPIEKGSSVTFRFLRINLNHWASSPKEINIFDSLNGGVGNYYYTDVSAYYFLFNPDYVVSMSPYYTYGMGIEYPLTSLTNKAKVYLVVPSKMGFADGISSVVPYLYYIEYNLSKN
ncbi:MAG: DUF4827 family protein [Bacteroidales bacterium]